MHTYCDDRGWSLMSLFDHIEDIPGQVNVSLMYAGVVKAWHRHALQDDYWILLKGHLKAGLFNTEDRCQLAELRLAGAAAGEDRTVAIEVPPGTGVPVYLDERRPAVLRIPRGLWHGAMALGGQDALLLYYVTHRYNTGAPDEQRETWNRFPFSWEVRFH